jgi:hypothetical protein
MGDSCATGAKGETRAKCWRCAVTLVDCNRQSGSDPMPGIGVLPLHGFRGLIVLPDIAHDFPFQILPRRKDAAGDEIALNLGEPEFDLVQPG